jgi:cytochrome P450
MDVTTVEQWLPSRELEGFPVMPGELPGLGHALVLHMDAIGALRRARAALGPVFWVNRGFGSRSVFCTGSGSFELLKDPRLSTEGAREALAFIVGRSLLNLDGGEHRRIRSAMNPTFSPRSP